MSPRGKWVNHVICTFYIFVQGFGYATWKVTFTLPTKLRKNNIHQNIWLIFLISLLTSYYLKYKFFFFVIMNFTLGYLKSQVVHNHSIYRQFRWHGRLRNKIIKAKVASWWILRPHVPHLKKTFRFINELMQGVLL